MEVVVIFQTLGDLYYVKCLISSCILWCHVSMYAVRLLAWTCPFHSDFVFFFFAFFPPFAIFSVNDEPSWIENGLLQLLLGNNGEGKKENNEGRKRKPQVMIKQFIKYFSAPPNKKHTIFSLSFQENTKINFSPSLQPPKYKIPNTNTKAISLSGSQQIHYWQCSPARPQTTRHILSKLLIRSDKCK